MRDVGRTDAEAGCPAAGRGTSEKIMAGRNVVLRKWPEEKWFYENGGKKVIR